MKVHADGAAARRPDLTGLAGHEKFRATLTHKISAASVDRAASSFARVDLP